MKMKMDDDDLGQLAECQRFMGNRLWEQVNAEIKGVGWDQEVGWDQGVAMSIGDQVQKLVEV